MEAIAKLNKSPIAPRKMRMVVDTIRGKEVGDALNILKFQAKAGAPAVEKLLLSAIANWEQKNESLSIEDFTLFVKEVYVTQGKSIKRFRPAPQGRAHPILKRSNNVTLIVDAIVNADEEPPAEENQENQENQQED